MTSYYGGIYHYCTHELILEIGSIDKREERLNKSISELADSNTKGGCIRRWRILGRRRTRNLLMSWVMGLLLKTEMTSQLCGHSFDIYSVYTFRPNFAFLYLLTACFADIGKTRTQCG